MKKKPWTAYPSRSIGFTPGFLVRCVLPIFLIFRDVCFDIFVFVLCLVLHFFKWPAGFIFLIEFKKKLRTIHIFCCFSLFFYNYFTHKNSDIFQQIISIDFGICSNMYLLQVKYSYFILTYWTKKGRRSRNCMVVGFITTYAIRILA
jgi:hypothetical protein